MSSEAIGRYHIKSVLGRGGMATVYLAYDPVTRRDVAVKVLPKEMLHNPAFRARFEREAQTVAALEHSAIVPIYDFGEHEDQPYLVMRCMAGGALIQRIREGPLSLSEAARILQRLGPALDEAHAQGIIHRDLKPGNILFDQYGEAFLSDFGIAKLVASGATLTGTGIIGTPAYMSPEQASGAPDLDARSDIYSLGAILYEMLSGQLPYNADTPMGLAMQHVTAPVPHIRTVRPDLPPACDQVIATAMAKQREDRYSRASDLAEEVARIAAGQPIAAPPASGPEQMEPPHVTESAVPVAPPTQPPQVVPPVPAPKAGRRVPWAWVLGGGAAVILCAAVAAASGFGLAWLGGGEPTAAPALTPPTPIVVQATVAGGKTPAPTEIGLPATPTGAPTDPPPPTLTPTYALAPVLVHPYCAMDGESPVTVERLRPVTLVWTWTAVESSQVQDHIDAATYEILLDGQPVEPQRRGEIEYDSEKVAYKVSWFAEIGILTPGEHLAERYLSWSEMITDGWNTFGPGGQIETEWHTCTIIVQ